MRGVTSAKRIFDMRGEDFDSVIRINSGGPFTCIRAVAAVKEQGRREVINTGSTAGTYGGKTNSRFFPEGHQRIDESRAKATGRITRRKPVALGVVAADMTAPSL